MKVRQLVQLYPRAWRDRYGDEFAEVVGESNLSAQQTIDIIAGAVDAWFSPSVRSSVRGPTAGAVHGGVTMIQELKMKCATSTPRYTTRDGLISAAVMLGTTSVLLASGIALRRQGFDTLGETLKALAFPASLLLSMPFYVMKGQSRRAQAILIGVPLLILVAITYLATKI